MSLTLMRSLCPVCCHIVGTALPLDGVSPKEWMRDTQPDRFVGGVHIDCDVERVGHTFYLAGGWLWEGWTGGIAGSCASREIICCEVGSVEEHHPPPRASINWTLSTIGVISRLSPLLARDQRFRSGRKQMRVC
jgi:hypothetical protein